MAIRKQWYEIISPKFLSEKKIGETLSTDPKYLIGRTISISMADLTGDFSKFYLKLNFRIESVDDKARAKFIGHECMQERIYRMVHRYMRRVDCIHDVTTKDNQRVRVKTIFILVKRVNTSIKDSARNITKKILEETAKEKNFEDFVGVMISGELQNSIRKQISKIYPVGNIEIRKSELLEEKKDKLLESKTDQPAKKKETKKAEPKKETSKEVKSDKKEPAKKANSKEKNKKATTKKSDKKE
jgi:small subunit ribosomal protein S3Ae